MSTNFRKFFKIFRKKYYPDIIGVIVKRVFIVLFRLLVTMLRGYG